jgi:hypothetical protein
MSMMKGQGHRRKKVFGFIFNPVYSILINCKTVTFPRIYTFELNHRWGEPDRGGGDRKGLPSALMQLKNSENPPHFSFAGDFDLVL